MPSGRAAAGRPSMCWWKRTAASSPPRPPTSRRIPRANTSSTMPGRRPTRGPAAATIPSSRSRCPSRPRRAAASSSRPDRPVDAMEAALAAGLRALRQDVKASSTHATFVTRAEWDRSRRAGLAAAHRPAVPFHQRRLCGVRRLPGGPRVAQAQDHPQGAPRRAPERHHHRARSPDRTSREAHWDAFFAFYMDTGSRKWGRPYLNRRFFSEVGRQHGRPHPAA